MGEGKDIQVPLIQIEYNSPIGENIPVRYHLYQITPDDLKCVSNYIGTQIYNTSDKEINTNRFEHIKKTILDFSNLSPNWDGYGAISISPEIISNVLTFIPLLSGEVLDYISDIFPNTNGTITLEWENKNKELLSLEIGNNYSYFVEYRDKKPKFVDGENILSDIKLISSDLSQLLS